MYFWEFNCMLSIILKHPQITYHWYDCKINSIANLKSSKVSTAHIFTYSMSPVCATGRGRWSNKFQQLFLMANCSINQKQSVPDNNRQLENNIQRGCGRERRAPKVCESYTTVLFTTHKTSTCLHTYFCCTHQTHASSMALWTATSICQSTTLVQSDIY